VRDESVGNLSGKCDQQSKTPNFKGFRPAFPRVRCETAFLFSSQIPRLALLQLIASQHQILMTVKITFTVKGLAETEPASLKTIKAL
jgi:hypothetical protein